MRGNKSTIRFCHAHPDVSEVVPSGPCPGDEYSTQPCPNRARFEFEGVARCARHTASVLDDLPVGGAS